LRRIRLAGMCHVLAKGASLVVEGSVVNPALDFSQLMLVRSSRFGIS
jgi:hypothetical protein